ncbi:hypothetical protein ABPG77_001819 [Micractinium sp. CCAP 211/92]
MFIAAYAGARPLGRPLPLLAEAPQASDCGSVPLHLIFAFARDPAHDGRFEFYDPWQLETAARQLRGLQRGMLSLAGAGFAWGPAHGVSLDSWVAAALESLQSLLDRYGLVGLDINYEEGLDAGGFAPAMAALVAQLKAWRPTLLVTISPFDDVWHHYRELLRLAGPSIDYINWQVYAELESPHSTADLVIAAYDRLAREVGGYQRLVLGVNTEPQQLRGPQLAASLEAFRRLCTRGIGGAFTWALDNSCQAGYAAERALLQIAAQPLGAPGQWQRPSSGHALLPDAPTKLPCAPAAPVSLFHYPPQAQHQRCSGQSTSPPGSSKSCCSVM